METNHRTFKPFDKVLIRLGRENKWRANFYSYYNVGLNQHVCTNGYIISDADILLYEGNEHLVDTNNDPDEEMELRMGECIMVANDPDVSRCEWLLREFVGIDESAECFTGVSQSVPFPRWKYAVRFSDFNPNNMKETKKHILCVKGAKVVRYRG